MQNNFLGNLPKKRMKSKMRQDSKSNIFRSFFLTASVLMILFICQPFPAQADKGLKTIRVAAFDHYPAIFMDKDGKVRGFFADLLEAVAEKEGWHIEYVYGTWAEGLENIKKGGLDLLTSVAYTQERDLFLDFGRVFAINVWGELYVHESSLLHSMTDMQGKRVAVMKNDYSARNFRSLAGSFGINCEYVELPGFEDVLRSVQNKEVDAGVVNSLFGSSRYLDYDVKCSDVVFSPFNTYFASAKDSNADILRKLDFYLEEWKADRNSPYHQGRMKWLRRDGGVTEVVPDWLWQALALLFLVTIVIALFNAVLRLRVRRATDKVLAYSHRLKESEARLSEFMKHVPALILIKDSDFRPVYANEKFKHYFQFEEWEGKTPHEIFPEETADSMISKDREAMEKGYVAYEEKWTDRYGDDHLFFTQKFRIDSPDSKLLLGAIISDITEEKKAEEALHEITEVFRLFMENNPIYVFIKDEKIRPVFLSRNFEKMLNRPLDEILGKSMDELFPPELAGPMMEDERKILREGKSIEVVEELDGRTYNTIKFPILINGEPRFLAGYTIDITDKRLAEEEKTRLFSQLLQSQKMESVGRLAGGVAHDFNNMLQAIIGFSDMALMNIEEGSVLHDYIMEIQKAANRSADLTKQLLAFARKQAFMPKILDLNDSITGLLKMLGRMLGEEINIVWMPGPELWKVRMDPTQIDQIITNLSVNSRDALKGNGIITIKTENIELDAIYCMKHAGAIPGEYVLLSLSDNGCGIDEGLLGKIFEPFFTTKDVGEGSGLGLATVYGIVKQNNGFINVSSALGKGTTFDVYIPRYEADDYDIEAPGERIAASLGTETVMLVEDEGILLNLGRAILRHHGYRVITAGSPLEALEVAEQYSDPIHLLVTDVVMPEMNGRELADRFVRIKPDAKCLFMSGYATDLITKRGALDEDSHFLQKPFSVVEFISKVKEVLES